MILVAVFAGLALVLAAIGLYGVVAYVVVQRRREFGVRLALGATSREIGRLVLAEGLRLTALGGAFGLAGALAAGQLLRGLLVGVSPFDAFTFAATLPLVGLVALVACVWPARRAAEANVLDVLRAE
jgi:ABC-type antimicrobial peptide transport system permease subunit